jgi:hypothetical protein
MKLPNRWEEWTLREYNFEDQLRIEDEYTPLVLRFLEQALRQKPMDVRSQRLEYDFLLGTQRLDLKTDTLIGDTKNFFIETESVRVAKKGWLYNQETDIILYLDTKNLRLHILPLRQLQQHENQILRWPLKEILQDKDYSTRGHTVPISEVSRWCNFKTVNLSSLANVKLADILEGKL